MGKIIDISRFKKRTKAVNEEAEFEKIIVRLSDEWNENQKKDTLNEFISISLQTDYLDYIHDLNIIAEVEKETNLSISFISPNYTDNDGYISTFVLNDKAYASILMDTEQKARCFCILLYHEILKLYSRIKEHG